MRDFCVRKTVDQRANLRQNNPIGFDLDGLGFSAILSFNRIENR